MSSLAVRTGLLLLAPCFLLAGPAFAKPQPPAPSTAKTRSGTGFPGNVAISPDASTLAWTELSSDGSALHLTEFAHPSHDITVSPQEDCSFADPAWSPSGDTLAFLAACGTPSPDPTVPTQQQIYLWSKATGNLRQLTHLKGELNQIAWSPDAKSIAFLFVANATRSAGALDAMSPQVGVIGQDNIEVQRVYSVKTNDGQGDFLTPANLHVYEFNWAPDAREIAFIGANPPGANNWWVAKLYTELVRLQQPDNPEAPTGVENIARPVLDPQAVPGPLHGLQIAVPRWSPDGKRIAFIGGLMSDQGSTGGDVWVVNATAGSQPIDITPNIDGTPCFEAWLTNNRIGMVEDRRGHTLLPDYDVKERAYIDGSSIDLGDSTISGGSIKDAFTFTRAAGFVLPFVRSSPTMPPEIWIVRGDNQAHQFSHLNDTVQLHPPRFESVEWTNEGFHVQGWLTFPRDYDPSKRYPLIVSVHGGPSASAGPYPDTMFSAQGYFVLSPNPRGSFGQGEKFVQANRKDFGYGDLRDILKGMDVIEAQYPIDKAREGITGWSYGGYMTMFAITQTHRFAAAVAGAGLSDWLSYYGENSIDQWMIPFFGASVYDDPAVYARSSPITFIKNARTPTLILVGDRDGECPAPQSFEFWHALRDLGVKTELVVYPDEGHGFRDPAHIRDRDQRTVQWFADNMPASSE